VYGDRGHVPYRNPQLGHARLRQAWTASGRMASRLLSRAVLASEMTPRLGTLTKLWPTEQSLGEEVECGAWQSSEFGRIIHPDADTRLTKLKKNDPVHGGATGPPTFWVYFRLTGVMRGSGSIESTRGGMVLFLRLGN
jgi:hypothetical protein